MAREIFLSITHILLSTSLRISDCNSLARNSSNLRGLTLKGRQWISGINLLLVQYLLPDTSLIAPSIWGGTCDIEERIDNSNAVSIDGAFLMGNDYIINDGTKFHKSLDHIIYIILSSWDLLYQFRFFLRCYT